MNREEAIKNIKEHCYFANLIPRAKEALDMAIKALEQELVLDKISAEVIDKSYLSYDDNPRRIIDESWVIEIIDKYRKEQTDADSD